MSDSALRTAIFYPFIASFALSSMLCCALFPNFSKLHRQANKKSNWLQ